MKCHTFPVENRSQNNKSVPPHINVSCRQKCQQKEPQSETAPPITQTTAQCSTNSCRMSLMFSRIRPVTHLLQSRWLWLLGFFYNRILGLINNSAKWYTTQSAVSIHAKIIVFAHINNQPAEKEIRKAIPFSAKRISRNKPCSWLFSL